VPVRVCGFEPHPHSHMKEINLMIRKCAWCDTLLDMGGIEEEDYSDVEVTHTICEECYAKQLTELGKVKSKTRSNAKSAYRHLVR
jgi:hypothetical protein